MFKSNWQLSTTTYCSIPIRFSCLNLYK